MRLKVEGMYLSGAIGCLGTHVMFRADTTLDFLTGVLLIGASLLAASLIAGADS